MSAESQSLRGEDRARPPRTRGRGTRRWAGGALGRVRRALARMPVAAWGCALVALLNAGSWAFITPPFLALDEPAHFAYVQYLAETGRLPNSSGLSYSEEEQRVLFDLRQPIVRFRPEDRPVYPPSVQRTLASDLNRPLSRVSEGDAGVAAGEPPLYYALASIPYLVGSGESILYRLELMRLLSVLMAAATALLVFLFLCEALPSAPWAWPVGGLGVAFAPLLGYASSSVDPDSLLFLISAAAFYLLARSFRRGLTLARALAIGLLCVVGLLAKLNFLGLYPGLLLGLVLLARRQSRLDGPAVYRRVLLPAMLLAFGPLIAYELLNLSFNGGTVQTVSGGAGVLAGAHRSLAGALSYSWQFYLPRLPWMHSDFGSISMSRVWYRDVIGMYGWGETTFPKWVYNLSLVPVAIIFALCARQLLGMRAGIRARASELLTYAVMAVGLLSLVAAAGYVQFPANRTEFVEARYILPLVVLWGAVLVLAARGAGRRWGPAVGALIVSLVIAHDLFSQLQVIARYYG